MPLRTANIRDASCVLGILTRSRNAYMPYAKSVHTAQETLNWICQQLIPSGNVIIAEHKSEAVGVMATSVSDGMAWIDQLFVAPGFINNGFGTQLLNHALENLPRPVRLWTFQQNHRAQCFNENHGFKAIKETNGENNEEQCPDVLYELDH